MQNFRYVRNKNEKESLIDFLLRRFPYQSRESWIKNVERGSLTVDGQVVSPGLILETKMLIAYDRPREDEPPIDENYRILHRDEWILVVEKNGNIPIAESGKYYRNTLINVLKEKEGLEELYAVHRLDRETSGVIVIARTKEMATRMGELFFAGIPQKTYHAVLQGELSEPRTVEARMRKIKPRDVGGENFVRIRQIVADDGKDSKTAFHPLIVKGGLTYARVELFTGRTHQIRLHASHIGHPLLGDKLYGKSDEEFVAIMKEEIPPAFGPFDVIERQLLHASRLAFPHPVTEEPLEFHSDAEPWFRSHGLDWLFD